MVRSIKKISSPDMINPRWDDLADFYFQKTEFLSHLHKYNPCTQRYYELYSDDIFVAGTVVYTLTINIFTFSNFYSAFKAQVIGLPVSVAAPPIIGDPGEFEYLLSEIIRSERGLILGINFMEDYLHNKVANLRTLPTIILNLKQDTLTGYENSLRHDYRRRIRRIREKFRNVRAVSSGCLEFSERHYALYLQIMKKTTTKLETLSPGVFKYLPSNFRLTTYYSGNDMLCWHITCSDTTTFFFFFGGMNYALCKVFASYNNNLLCILSAAIDKKYRLIDFGQTAETAKSRLGGEPDERRMFLFHRNPIILRLIRLLSSLINYTKRYEKPHVFKLED